MDLGGDLLTFGNGGHNVIDLIVIHKTKGVESNVSDLTVAIQNQNDLLRLLGPIACYQIVLLVNHGRDQAAVSTGEHLTPKTKPPHTGAHHLCHGRIFHGIGGGTHGGGKVGAVVIAIHALHVGIQTDTVLVLDGRDQIPKTGRGAGFHFLI